MPRAVLRNQFVFPSVRNLAKQFPKKIGSSIGCLNRRSCSPFWGREAGPPHVQVYTPAE